MSIIFDAGVSPLYIPEVLDDEVNNEDASYPKLEDTEEQKPSEEASDRNEKRLEEVIEVAFIKKLEVFSAVFFVGQTLYQLTRPLYNIDNWVVTKCDDLLGTETNFKIALGVATLDFLATSILHKGALLLGYEFEEIEEEEEEKKDWKYEAVIQAPLIEELLFRIIGHTLVDIPLRSCLVVLNSIGILPAFNSQKIVCSILVSLVVGRFFAKVHEENFEKGGALAANIMTPGGVALGVLREFYGFNHAVVAHAVHNLFVGLFDECFPTFLESPKEKERRLQEKGAAE